MEITCNERVFFQLDNQRFAVSVAHTLEIVPLPELTRVADSPPILLGLMNLRGNILAVIDIRSIIGLPSAQWQEGKQALILETGGRQGAVMVDQVLDVVEVGSDVLQPPPVTLPGLASGCIDGILSDPRDPVICLNVERLFNRPEISEL